MPAPRRTLWKCRRGMREMDILLERFVERGYDELDAAGRAAFEALLELPDQDILAWLLGACGPSDPEMGSLIEHMRRTVNGT